MNKYHLVVCGGTFDLLHKGHKEFIKKILEISDKAIVGLTSDKYVNQNKPNKKIKSFDHRKKELINFLKEVGLGNRVEIIKIDDMYGPLLDSSFKVDALVVASDKNEEALEINLKRKKRGMIPVRVIEIPIIKAKDGEILSATRIRQGFVDRKGNLLLPQALRDELKKPFGELITDIPENLNISKLITVGDVTTKNFLDKKLNPILAIVDFKVERKPIGHTDFKNVEIINATNPPGIISFELLEAVRRSFKTFSKKVIIVDGEEDLAVFPAIIYAPLRFEVFYGQPNEGLVRIEVTQEMKNKARKLLELFEKQ